MNEQAELNTDTPLRRCPTCGSRMRYDGYWIICRRSGCAYGSRHDPRMNKFVNRFRLWVKV